MRRHTDGRDPASHRRSVSGSRNRDRGRDAPLEYAHWAFRESTSDDVVLANLRARGDCLYTVLEVHQVAGITDEYGTCLWAAAGYTNAQVETIAHRLHNAFIWSG